VIHTGALTPKNSSGFNLTQLFCRSEGTLGVITEIGLKILPSPEYVAFAQAGFPSLEAAGLTVAFAG